MAIDDSRRSFLRRAAVFTAAGYRALRGASPNDRINVAFIGVGSQGTGRLREFMRHADVNVVAVCDVDSRHAERAAALVEAAGRPKPPVFGDFRKALELKDVDAAMAATPDHWHALPFIHACGAGKDVFVEKPLCYSVGEGRAMLEAARRGQRITQLGNHIHNDLPNYRRVVELIRSGMLGDVRRVHCWIRSNGEGIGAPPDGPAPKELDYDFWLGPAPKRPYNPNRVHSRFRYFWDYSGGVFIDFWCHITDLFYWALDPPAPKSVSAAGGRYLKDDNAETPNMMEALYEYPGLTLTWTVHPRGLAGFENRNIGILFQGTEATLLADYQTHEVFVRGKPVADFKRPERSIPDSPGHIREFLDSIKSRRKTTCDIEYAYRLTKAGLLANIALRTGRRLHWDDARERFAGDRGANAYLTRRYRKPWRLS
jgi:predicted dehydrogenase